MKTICAMGYALLLGILICGQTFGNAPAPVQAIYSTSAKIISIGNGTMALFVSNGQGGGRLEATANEQTQVILPGGKPGKLSDLRKGQWITAFWNGDPSAGPILRIEPGMSMWVRQKLDALLAKKGSAQVNFSLHQGAKVEAELSLIGPDVSPDTAAAAARLTNDQMIGLLKYLAYAGCIDAETAQNASPPASGVTISVADSVHTVPFTKGGRESLEALKATLPEAAAKEFAALLEKMPTTKEAKDQG